MRCAGMNRAASLWDAPRLPCGNPVPDNRGRLPLDGVDVTVTLAPSTVYKGSATTASEVKVGVRAGVVAKDATARVVLSGTAPTDAKAP